MNFVHFPLRCFSLKLFSFKNIIVFQEIKQIDCPPDEIVQIMRLVSPERGEDFFLWLKHFCENEFNTTFVYTGKLTIYIVYVSCLIYVEH